MTVAQADTERRLGVIDSHSRQTSHRLPVEELVRGGYQERVGGEADESHEQRADEVAGTDGESMFGGHERHDGLGRQACVLES